MLKDGGRSFEYVGPGALDQFLAGTLAGASVTKSNATMLVSPEGKEANARAIRRLVPAA